MILSIKGIQVKVGMNVQFKNRELHCIKKIDHVYGMLKLRFNDIPSVKIVDPREIINIQKL